MALERWSEERKAEFLAWLRERCGGGESVKPGRKPNSGAGLTQAERERLLVVQMMGLDDGDVADPNKAFRALLPYQSPRIRNIYARIMRGEDWNEIALVWHTNAETVMGYARILRNHGYKVKAPPKGWRANRTREHAMGCTMARLKPELIEEIRKKREAGVRRVDIKNEYKLGEYELEQIWHYIAHGDFKHGSHKRRRVGVQDSGGEAQR